ncbi:MAG TPA: hypothetical protein VLY63_20230 [Anaerolineae bacterium]|nr:hypothetical protein [Anaerolineae bacterium]
MNLKAIARLLQLDRAREICHYTTRLFEFYGPVKRMAESGRRGRALISGSIRTHWKRTRPICGRWERQHPLPYSVNGMFQSSIRMIRAEPGWVERFILQIEEEHGEN